MSASGNLASLLYLSVPLSILAFADMLQVAVVVFEEREETTGLNDRNSARNATWNLFAHSSCHSLHHRPVAIIDPLPCDVVMQALAQALGDLPFPGY